MRDQTPEERMRLSEDLLTRGRFAIPASVARGQRLIDARDWTTEPITVDEVLDITRGIDAMLSAPYLPERVSYFERDPHAPTLREVYEMRERLRQYAYRAYTPLDVLTRLGAWHAADDMRDWITSYVNRTEPTDNERTVLHVGPDGKPQHGRNNGSLSFYNDTLDTPFVESSDYPGAQPGWYALTPCQDREVRKPRILYIAVNRMYPEGDVRQLVHLCPTWHHPSREYALELARQILRGYHSVWGWKSECAGNLRDISQYNIWVRIPFNHLSHVTVERVPDGPEDTAPECIRVDTAYLDQRGQ